LSRGITGTLIDAVSRGSFYPLFNLHETIGDSVVIFKPQEDHVKRFDTTWGLFVIYPLFCNVKAYFLYNYIVGCVIRTEEQMKEAELVTKYTVASLKASESEIEFFIHSVAAVILAACLSVLVMFS